MDNVIVTKDAVAAAETQPLEDRLMAAAVWAVSIADHYADTLSPRQIKQLYAVSDAARDAIDHLAAQQQVEPVPVAWRVSHPEKFTELSEQPLTQADKRTPMGPIEDRAAALEQLLSQLQDGNAWDSTISLLTDYADLVRDLMQDRLAVRADERAKVVAEIAAAWQPMETAPKDGTIVQLFDPVAEPPVSVGCWDEQAGMDGRPGWLIAEADFMPSLCRPRCWAPLLTRPDIAPDAKSESAVAPDIVALIVAELLDLDGQRDESNLLGWAANMIEAKFGGRDDESNDT